MLRFNTKKTWILGAIILSLTACSHGPTIQDFPDTASPIDEVAGLERDLSAASATQVNVLSPRNFEESQDFLKDAKKSLDKQRDAKDTLHLVARGRAYLNQANAFAQISHANIEDVITARQQAIQAGAPNAFATDFRRADDDLRNVTTDIENNDLKAAIANRTLLQLKYLDLELQSIKESALKQPRETIAQARKDGAKEFAPRSLALAEKSVLDTDAFITANRHDSVQIKLRSDETRRSADHLSKIARESKAGNKTSSEDVALKLEGEKSKVAAKQVELDDKQIQLYATENQLTTKQNQLAQGKNENLALTSENQNLESEKAFNRRFEEARSEFTQSEAEVYKQGNTLMIRLRGLEFPVSQAVLKGSNFPLLAKVEKVIRNFGKSSVVIEGHTDSNGGKALNEKLSSDRAQAVKEYLTSNAGAEVIQIRAIGYGDQKPLATNRTSVGRAEEPTSGRADSARS